MNDARASVDAVLALLRELVRIPSRAGEDALAPVLTCIEQWFGSQGLPFTRLQGPDGQPLGLYAEVQGRRGPGRWTVLDATLDTAGFGNPASWRHAPDAAVVDDGWLYGRGSADSKAGVALFAHLLLEFSQRTQDFAGRFGLLFDLDEHSGRFGGARAFFESPFAGGAPPRPDGVVIGYPGMDRIMSGARGFLRARITVHGIAAHSGATGSRGVNAIVRALALAQALDRLALPAADAAFALPPQLTLTGLQAGDAGFSQVPDRCELRLDLRLTPAFSDSLARARVVQAVEAADAGRGAVPATRIDWLPGWPAYRVDDDHPLVAALREAGRNVLGHDLPSALAGPSNIGNYLATLGVPALCGFGVQGEGIHAADERVALDSIAPVYRIYRQALLRLQQGGPSQAGV